MALALLAGTAMAGTTAAGSTAASLGQEIFFDASLSASGQMSCASCHNPAKAHAATALPVIPGGQHLDVPGFRTVPSLRYLNFTTAFFFDKEGTPTGGLDRDGRADTPLQQAMRPLLAPHEMANPDVATAAARLSAASYAADFRRVFGDDVFDDPERALLSATFAIEQYEETSPNFRPFSSKFDLFLKGKVSLSVPELRGYALFNRPDKGNCNGCHVSLRGPKGEPPLFTDFTYDNLGVPRNDEIPATADPAYYDLGLCGPDRTDLAADHPDLCGAFKVPTLRNVATRSSFFHNGRFHDLTEALRFYVRRDTNPAEFYPTLDDGTVAKFNDLPPEFRGNVNISEVPYDRHPGQAPRLSDAEIADVVAFLHTLTDGYDPVSRTADPARGQTRLLPHP